MLVLFDSDGIVDGCVASDIPSDYLKSVAKGLLGKAVPLLLYLVNYFVYYY